MAVKNSKPHHGHEWMPIMYVTYFGMIKDIAKRHGYALAVHGSVTRDFDLVAIPWDEFPSSHLDLLTDIQKIIGIADPAKQYPWDSHGVEPNGRYCYTITCGAGGYFDISITPSIKQVEDLIEKAKRDKVESDELLQKCTP